MMVAALAGSRSTRLPKNSWIGLSDRPRGNVAELPSGAAAHASGIERRTGHPSIRSLA